MAYCPEHGAQIKTVCLHYNAVTIRDRDTMQQFRVPIPDLLDTFQQKLEH